MYRYCNQINCPPGTCCDAYAYCGDIVNTFCYPSVNYYYYDYWWIYVVIGIVIFIIAIISGVCIRRNRMRRRQQDTIIIQGNNGPSYVTGQPVYTNNVNQGTVPQNNYEQAKDTFNQGAYNVALMNNSDQPYQGSQGQPNYQNNYQPNYQNNYLGGNQNMNNY